MKKKNEVKHIGGQVQYLGRWVPREHFRVWVFNKNCQKLVNSYDEFIQSIGSGIWFESKEAYELHESDLALKEAVEKEVERQKDIESSKNVELLKPRGKKISEIKKAVAHKGD